MPAIEYATVKKLEPSDIRSVRKRPSVLYEVNLGNETFILVLRPNKFLVSPGKFFSVFIYLIYLC